MESDSDTRIKSEAHEENSAQKKKKGDGGKSLQPKAPKKKKNPKATLPPEPQAWQENESWNQAQKELESPNEANHHGAPDANEPAAPEKATFAAEV